MLVPELKEMAECEPYDPAYVMCILPHTFSVVCLFLCPILFDRQIGGSVEGLEPKPKKNKKESWTRSDLEMQLARERGDLTITIAKNDMSGIAVSTFRSVTIVLMISVRYRDGFRFWRNKSKPSSRFLRGWCIAA